jgi:hypothetical protein
MVPGMQVNNISAKQKTKTARKKTDAGLALLIVFFQLHLKWHYLKVLLQYKQKKNSKTRTLGRQSRSPAVCHRPFSRRQVHRRKSTCTISLHFSTYWAYRWLVAADDAWATLDIVIKKN